VSSLIHTCPVVGGVSVSNSFLNPNPLERLISLSVVFEVDLRILFRCFQKAEHFESHVFHRYMIPENSVLTGFTPYCSFIFQVSSIERYGRIT